VPLFPNHSTNISRIANLNAGGETAAKAEQFTYWPCHDTIKTQLLNLSQSCRKPIFGMVVRFQPGQILTVLRPVRVKNPPRQSGWGLWPCLEPIRNKPLVKTWTTGGLPGPVGNTRLGALTTSLGQPTTSIGVATTRLGALATCLGAPRITVEQSVQNILFFGKAAGGPGYHSYYLLFNNFQNSCIQFVFSSMYLYSYPSIHGMSGLAEGGAWDQLRVRQKMTIDWT